MCTATSSNLEGVVLNTWKFEFWEFGILKHEQCEGLWRSNWTFPLAGDPDTVRARVIPLVKNEDAQNPRYKVPMLFFPTRDGGLCGQRFEECAPLEIGRVGGETRDCTTKLATLLQTKCRGGRIYSKCPTVDPESCSRRSKGAGALGRVNVLIGHSTTQLDQTMN
jgi:hypothetical protein